MASDHETRSEFAQRVRDGGIVDCYDTTHYLAACRECGAYIDSTELNFGGECRACAERMGCIDLRTRDGGRGLGVLIVVTLIGFAIGMALR